MLASSFGEGLVFVLVGRSANCIAGPMAKHPTGRASTGFLSFLDGSGTSMNFLPSTVDCIFFEVTVNTLASS